MIIRNDKIITLILLIFIIFSNYLFLILKSRNGGSNLDATNYLVNYVLVSFKIYLGNPVWYQKQFIQIENYFLSWACAAANLAIGTL